MLNRTGGGRIAAMREDTEYKYLGYAQSNRIQDKKNREELKRNVMEKRNAVLKIKLNSTNLVKAINTFVLPILASSFGIISWAQTVIDDVNRMIRVAFT